jgi:hypothetical protein
MGPVQQQERGMGLDRPRKEHRWELHTPPGETRKNIKQRDTFLL